MLLLTGVVLDGYLFSFVGEASSGRLIRLLCMIVAAPLETPALPSKILLLLLFIMVTLQLLKFSTFVVAAGRGEPGYGPPPVGCYRASELADWKD